MPSVRKIQYPEQRHLIIAGRPLSAHRPIESAPAELRFAFRIAAAVDGIAFDDGDNTL